MSDQATQRYAEGLEAALQALYGVSSRADPADICQEVLKMNLAIQTLAERHLDPLQPVADFRQALLSLADATHPAQVRP